MYKYMQKSSLKSTHSTANTGCCGCTKLVWNMKVGESERLICLIEKSPGKNQIASKLSCMPSVCEGVCVNG